MTAGTGGAGGGVGTAANFLEIDSTGVTTITDTASATTAGVFVTETIGDLKVKTVDTKGDATLATVSGSILDARNDGNADVIANTINLRALGGTIGTSGDDLEIDSQKYVTGGTFGAQGQNGVYVTETTGNLRVVETRSSAGDIRLTVRETSVQGENLDLLPSGGVLYAEATPVTVTPGAIAAAVGAVELRVGDDMTDTPDTTVTAGKGIGSTSTTPTPAARTRATGRTRR